MVQKPTFEPRANDEAQSDIKMNEVIEVLSEKVEIKSAA
jgi:hypothetical protein